MLHPAYGCSGMLSCYVARYQQSQTWKRSLKKFVFCHHVLWIQTLTNCCILFFPQAIKAKEGRKKNLLTIGFGMVCPGFFRVFRPCSQLTLSSTCLEMLVWHVLTCPPHVWRCQCHTCSLGHCSDRSTVCSTVLCQPSQLTRGTDCISRQ